MKLFFRKQLTVFLIGFVIAFVIYLFARFDTDKVFTGLMIAAAVGLAGNIGFYFLGKRFPDEPAPGDQGTANKR